MLIVVLDSATPAITAALASVDDAGVEVVAESVTVDARAHGELLGPAVASVLAAGRATARDLGAIVAGVGPGPFTGLRVGLVTAAALADALNIPAYGVCTLDALGWATGPGARSNSLAGRGSLAGSGSLGPGAGVDLSSGQGPGAGVGPGSLAGSGPGVGPGAGVGAGTVLVATDARRKEVYWAVYRDGVRLTEPSVGRPAELSLPDGVGAAVGDGALRYADVLGLPVLDEPRYPPAAGFAALAADAVRVGAPTQPLTPMYLRRPDAVAPGARKPALP